MNIEIIRKAQVASLPPAKIKSSAKSVLKQLKIKKKSLTIVFVSRAQMRVINKIFRGKNKPTDVLSFAPIEPESLGELVLCMPILKTQAKANGHSIFNEFQYLLIHGVLHLLGYDHETNDKDAQRMYRLQDKLFDKLRK